MTLIVSEVSVAFGCVLVGDSAVTVRRPGRPTEVRTGAAKVHYSDAANIGFALWGNACFAGTAYDALVADFANSLTASDTPTTSGEALADLLLNVGQKDGRPWDKMRTGAHVAGYENGAPVLYHVHTGGESQPQHPPRLHRDFPAVTGAAQLRNGFFPMFNALFPGMEAYAQMLSVLGFTWPQSSLDDRVSYYEIAVRTVSDTLRAAGRLPQVGGNISAVAFTSKGLAVDRRIAGMSALMCDDGVMADFYAGPPNIACSSQPRCGWLASLA